MGITVSSCLNETETEVVPVNRVRRVFYGILAGFKNSGDVS